MTEELVAVRVEQWLQEWGSIDFDPAAHRAEPPHHFLLTSVNAALLRRLSGVSRRSTYDALARSADIGIQRGHDKKRSAEIREYIHHGYPWSGLSEAKRRTGRFGNLRKPGWLPTAVVVNVLTEGDTRRGNSVAASDLVRAGERGDRIILPVGCNAPEWEPSALPPIEIIDGQHRLYAFGRDDDLSGYDLPVVAFVGLDISWQAYLFWTINIKPKRINPSLAFDLYPLLRTEEWLEQAEGLAVYRETRAQELVESLWLSLKSPWYQRINMLGETGLQAMVTQAAWIRSLMATLVKAGEGQRVSIGGLFGASHRTNEDILPWTRAQQAAFLITVGNYLRNAIEDSDEPWARDLRESDGGLDPAFYGSNSLLTTDQGIRGFLHIYNDLCFLAADDIGLDGWVGSADVDPTDIAGVDVEVSALVGQPFAAFLQQVATSLSSFDWRTSSAPGLEGDELLQLRKAALRGSGGYKELRKQLLQHISNSATAASPYADQALGILGYE